MVSDSYDDILVELIEHFRDVRLQCEFCKQRLKNKQSLAKRYEYFHRIQSNKDEGEDD